MNHAALLGGHQLVSVAIGLHNPLGERFADDGVSDVADELAWQPAPVLLIGQVVEYLWVLTDLLEDVLNGEGPVHRHVDVAHAVTLDVLPTEGVGLADARSDVTFSPRGWP